MVVDRKVQKITHYRIFEILFVALQYSRLVKVGQQNTWSKPAQVEYMVVTPWHIDKDEPTFIENIAYEFIVMWNQFVR